MARLKRPNPIDEGCGRAIYNILIGPILTNLPNKDEHENSKEYLEEVFGIDRVVFSTWITTKEVRFLGPQYVAGLVRRYGLGNDTAPAGTFITCREDLKEKRVDVECQLGHGAKERVFWLDLNEWEQLKQFLRPITLEDYKAYKKDLKKQKVS